MKTCPYLALSGFDQPVCPLKTSPLNIIVGLNTFPLAEMMGMRVAVLWTSLCKANWCTCFAELMCQVFDVFLSRTQHVSSIEKMQSSSMLYSLIGSHDHLDCQYMHVRSHLHVVHSASWCLGSHNMLFPWDTLQEPPPHIGGYSARQLQHQSLMFNQEYMPLRLNQGPCTSLQLKYVWEGVFACKSSKTLQQQLSSSIQAPVV